MRSARRTAVSVRILTGWVDWFLRGFSVAAETGLAVATEFAPAVQRKAEELGLSERLGAGLAEIWLAGSISRAEYRTVLGVSTSTAANDLALLTAHGVVAREGQGRSTRYVSRLSPLDDIIREAGERAQGSLGDE